MYEKKYKNSHHGICFIGILNLSAMILFNILLHLKSSIFYHNLHFFAKIIITISILKKNATVICVIVYFSGIKEILNNFFLCFKHKIRTKQYKKIAFFKLLIKCKYILFKNPYIKYLW